MESLQETFYIENYYYNARFSFLWCCFSVQFEREYSKICVVSVVDSMYEKTYGISHEIRLYGLSLR